jgi:group II intron reverse transcriptase/maturase
MFGFGSRTLYRQVYEDATLTEAWRKVRAGTTAAGVDEMTVAQFEARLFANLKALQDDLRKHQYQPQPVKRISVPKADGTRRPLGILTVRDRIVQRAVLEVIGPVFDRSFEECSHAFRRGRSVHTALAQVARLIQQQHGWLVDLDIASFFERIDTSRLFKFIKHQLTDGELRRLIRAWLEVETVVVTRTGVGRKEAPRGILQGGVLSPLFANVYLDRLDKHALGRGLKLVRYGDDIVVCCRSQAEAQKTLRCMQKLLARLDLDINPRKTTIVHAEKGFRFLGERLYLKTSPSGKPRLAGWRSHPNPPSRLALPPAQASGIAEEDTEVDPVKKLHNSLSNPSPTPADQQEPRS